MRKRIPVRSIALGLGLLALAGFWLARRDDVEAERGSDPGLLLDRLWVDSKPTSHTS
jgi:hypothetical protein